MRFALYEWNAWWDFKLVRALPDAARLTARPGEDAEQVLDRCPPSVTAFAFHINATYTTEFPRRRDTLIAGLEQRGIVPINAGVVDISKRWVQQRCAACGLPVATALADGDPNERVIVKTDHNYGGFGERLLTPEQRGTLGVPRPSATVMNSRAYKVLTRGQVPLDWWTDASLAIERFIENRCHRIYRVSFAGRRFDILRMVNTHLIKKVEGAQEKVVLFATRDQLERDAVSGLEAGVGPAVARFVGEAQLDFGGLDVMADDEGRTYVLDVNTTPYGVRNALRRVMSIRRGLFELVAERAQAIGRPAPAMTWRVWPTAPMLLGEMRRLMDLRKASH